jgi:hypothetical protein
MLSLKSRFTRLSASLVVTTALTLGAALPAFADESDLIDVAQTLNGGSRSVTVVDQTTHDPVAYSHVAQNVVGSMLLTVDDSTATGAGWHVTIQSTAFDYDGLYDGTAGGIDIPATNFSIATPAAPAVVAGQPYDVTGGPNIVGTGGELANPVEVIEANVGFGLGTYTQAIAYTFTIPAQSRAGTYTATLTASLIAAP